MDDASDFLGTHWRGWRPFTRAVRGFVRVIDVLSFLIDHHYHWFSIASFPGHMWWRASASIIFHFCQSLILVVEVTGQLYLLCPVFFGILNTCCVFFLFIPWFCFRNNLIVLAVHQMSASKGSFCHDSFLYWQVAAFFLKVSLILSDKIAPLMALDISELLMRNGNYSQWMIVRLGTMLSLCFDSGVI